MTRDDDALALYIPTDGGIPTLKAVLEVLDTQSIEAEALTIHTPDLGDVFLACTVRFQADDGFDRRKEDLP
ncbi:hypothetical protein ACWFRJ_13065 [Streptomyces sp. NPDC055239]